MLRSIIAIGAIMLGAAPAAAASYSATLSVPTAGRFIVRDISWSCTAAGCAGTTENSRPVVLCQSLAKRAGRVAQFVADGRAFGPAELNQCNGSAKSVAVK